MDRQLHLISDGNFSKQHLEIMKRIHQGIDYFHIREKKKTAKEILEIMEALESIEFPLTKVIVNDRADIAVMKQCAGIHLAYHSPPISLVKDCFSALVTGKSVHSLPEAEQAQREGANYLLYGHIYTSSSKPNQQPRGLTDLRKITNVLSVPVYAIGGITPERTKEVIAAGVSGIAVMSGVWKADNPVQTVEAYRRVLDTWEGG
ncbi:thiamine phosphate synthase [Oceanobacillus neutriphilus]|uniref:Thiamine phosphate synthase n=1 Tax=Oceanobacillus neutriphilus TaxID=531815 RepID=A0ABQ2NVP1_9BACI|nr:thiamine phosphate synthase [Oceanobacillus neutriphilus]GGP11788.1 thiamine phosphate synthase [Oceanobacillus neutriphilus]